MHGGRGAGFRRNVRRIVTALAAAVLILSPAGPARADELSQRWIGTWATALMQPNPGLVPSWAEEGFQAQTLRQVVRISAGGKAVRLTLSNAFGATPLTVAGVTVARSGGGARVLPGTVRHLTFGGAVTATVPPGGTVVSDAAPISVTSLESLTVTAYLPERTGPATYHSWAGATSYRAAGDHRADVPGDAFSESTQSWYYLAGVDVLATSQSAGSVAAFGDSITDGYGSTVDANNRYPDELAERRGSLGVLNLGISGNRLLSDSPCLGERGVGRFARDVLTKPGLRAVVVQEGINDIGSRGTLPCIGEAPIVTAQDLIEGHRDIIRQARGHGLTVVGGTLLPYEGAAYYREEGEAIREAVNTWIRGSGEYDAVVDFDKIMADPLDVDRLNPAYDSGDHLHPNDAGYAVMGEAVARALK